MAASPNVGAQLREMLNKLKHFEKTTASTGSQDKDLFFMSLLWPLLPLLPPEPPAILTDLLKEPEKCDLCGTSQGSPAPAYRRTQKDNIEPIDPTGSSLHQRRISDWKTPLDRLMMDIENKMNETLNSIQATTEKNTELSLKASEIEKSQMSDLTDADLLKTLKKLAKEKADRTEKVSILETKEKQLKESLTNAIEWARSVQVNKHTPKSDRVTFENTALEKDNLPNDDKTMKDGG